ncbi:MAG: hypothetical protein ACI3WQ_01095 [Faecousia sp.]
MNIYDENMNIGRKNGCTDTKKCFLWKDEGLCSGEMQDTFFPFSAEKDCKIAISTKKAPTIFEN